jgi:hypothetical protein
MIVPFPARTAEGFRLKVTLRKDSRVWVYEIRPLAPDEAQTWVRHNGQPHRALMARSLVAIAQVYGQYVREIASLEQDGWVRD